MHDDFDACLRAVRERDRRCDGRFVSTVRSTGIYCRPSCPAGPRVKTEHLRFVATPDEARAAGFRACRRCRPDEAFPAAAR